MLIVRRSAWLCLVAQFVFLAPRAVCGAEADDPHDVLSFLVTGLKAERQRLRQGVFRVHGVQIREDPAPVGKLEGPVEMLGAFDFDKGCYRFDRRAPSWKVEGKESELLDRKICRTPELSLHYNSRYARLEIHPPDVLNPHTLTNITGGYLDVRCVGIYSFGQLFKSLELEAVCERIPKKIGLETCVEESNGIFRLDWTPVQETHGTWWIDTSHGFTLIRKESRHRLPELGETEWRDPYQTHEVTWKQIADVWVPGSYRVFFQFELAPEKLPEPPDYKYTPRHRKFTYRYTFEWESVNEPVDEKYFDYEEFDLPDGTYVADARSGELRILDVVGKPLAVSRDLSEPPTSSWSWPRVLALLASGLLLLLFGIFAWRRNRP